MLGRACSLGSRDAAPVTEPWTVWCRLETTRRRTRECLGQSARVYACMTIFFVCEHNADTAGIVCPCASDYCRQLSSPIAPTSPLQQRLRPRAENLRRVLLLLITVHAACTRKKSQDNVPDALRELTCKHTCVCKSEQKYRHTQVQTQNTHQRGETGGQ